jgi:hypothetical protein
MTDSGHIDDFEAYLKRRVPIDRRLALIHRLEPPPELDRIILNRAREAIRGPAPVPVFRAPKWALPMGLAATILVSLSLLLDLGMRGAIRKDAAYSPAIAAVSSAARTPATQSEPLEEALVPSADVASAEVPSPGALAARVRAAEPPAPASPAAPPANAAPSADGSPSIPFARSAARVRSPAVKTTPWPPLPGANVPATASSKAASVADDAADSSARYGARSRVTEQDLAASRLRTAQNASGSAVPIETVTITASRYHTESQAMAAVTVTAFPDGGLSVDNTALSASPAAAVPNIHIESGSARPSTRLVVGSAAERRKHPDPRAWLDYIEKMRAAGLTSEAEQEFKHFRDVYPGYSVPPEAAPADGRTQ